MFEIDEETRLDTLVGVINQNAAPTGERTRARVIELMFDLARQQHTAVVLITHDPGLAARADRVFTMTLGELTETTAAGRE